MKTDTSEGGGPGLYAFWIVVSASVMMAMTAPGQTIAVSVFVDPMIVGLDLTRSQMSVAYLIGTLGGAAALPWVGRLIDRFGVRRASACVASAFGLALIAMGGTRGFATLILGFVGIRLLGQGSLSLISTTAVALWFSRRRGLAIGITTSVGAAGISLAPLVIAAIISRSGWRTAWLIAGVIVWVVVLPMTRILRDARPATRSDPCVLASAPQVSPAASWSRAEAIRTLMFWTIAGAVGTTALVTTGIAFHQISLLGERGLTVTQAASNFLPQTGAAIVVSFGMGALVDRFAPRFLLVSTMGLLAGAIVLAQVARPGALAIAFGIAAGSSTGAMKTLEATIVPRSFGVDHLGTIRGTMLALQVGASAYGPTLLALGFERWRSYGPMLSLLLILPTSVSVLALFARVPDKPMLDHIKRRRQGG